MSREPNLQPHVDYKSMLQGAMRIGGNLEIHFKEVSPLSKVVGSYIMIGQAS